MKARILFLFAFILLLNGTRLHAGVESITSSLAGDLAAPIQPGAFIQLDDQWYPYPTTPTLWSNIFRVKDAKANVVLRYDDHLRTYTNKRWQINVTYDVTVYNDVASTNSTITGESLTIDYDPREGFNYTDRDLKQYSNADRVLVKVKTVTYTEWSPASSSTPTTSGTIPSWLNDVYLDAEVHVERYYNLSTASAPTITTTVNSTTNELEVNWNYVQGAESYDVEWLFVDVGNGAVTGSYDYDWRNAVRVNTPDQHYNIALAYPKGILLVRVRGVGIDWNNYTTYSYLTRGEGNWTSTATTGNTSSYTGTRYNISTGLLPGMNWSYSAGFAEDGKRMDGAAFYDGMMRGREAVTTVNTDGDVLVATSAFDFEGRPAVSVLPYPEANNGIKFYAASADYDCQDFDTDGKLTNPSTMTTGAGAYYSTSNTTATGLDAQLPNAGGYPYTHVTYMSDGTNRPASSSAAGENLKAGSTRETQYFYGTPSQNQLDRLFGNEVGYATHYKKNFVIDPNGVISVSYIDQHGRVIATALAGSTPSNLQSIDNPNGNPMTSTAMTDDLLGNNHERVSGDGTEAMNTLTVTESALHSFSYTLSSGSYSDGCYATSESCKYDLVIMLYNTATQDSVDINGASAGYAQRYTNISAGTYTFSVTLTPGTYRVEKTLTIDQDNLDALRATYMAYQRAHKGAGDCLDSILPSPVPCPGDCHDACLQHYYHDGTYYDDDGVALSNQGSGESDPGPMLIAACQQKLCDKPKTPDPCEVIYDGLVADVSPGGQYFDNLPSHFSINATTGLQSINSNYHSYVTSGPTYHSGDENNWLNANVKDDENPSNTSWFHSTFGSTIDNWMDVRNNWDPSWATNILLTYHPEYCAWNYHCNWSCIYTIPGTSTTDTLTSANDHGYEQQTMYETDGNYSGSDGYYWNPLNMNTNGTHSYSTQDTSYLPYGSTNTIHLDPRFAGSCDFTICDSPTISAKSTLEHYLKYFYPAYNSSNVLIGYYSVWYVALDPDNIAGTAPGTLSTATIDFFQQLHGNGSTIPGLINATPAAGQVTPYQFFRSVYFYYRTLVIEQGFVGDAAVASCEAGRDFPDYDAQGYLAASTTNPILTPEGFTIYYTHNPLIDIYGDGCNTPSMAAIADSLSAIVDAGAANPDSINIPASASGTCSCQMLRDYVSSRGLDSTDYAAIATSLNDEFEVSTYTSTMVGNWYTECHSSDPSLSDLSGNSFPEALTCNLDFQITNADSANQVNCRQENNDLAAYTANFMYENQLQAATDAYMTAYINRCLSSAAETFSVDYNLHEYYYTLYYYDQAGNLVKTIPPEGVNLIDLSADDLNGNSIADGIDIKNYRDDLRDHDYSTVTTTYTPGVHDMRSVYVYNSLQQPIKAQQNSYYDPVTTTTSWESGETSFWYDYLGRLVVSQNSKQANMSPPAYSYTRYDALGRIYEVGEIHTTATLTATTAGSRDNSGQYYYFDINHVTSPTALDDFLDATSDPSATRNDVTYTYYDEAMAGTASDVTSAFGTAGQENLRNRVSAVVYDDDPSSTYDLYGFSVSGQPGHLSAFYYSYDVHGNAKTVVQETPPLKTHNQNVKTTTYEYDLVSGNVNAVHYQAGQRDEFHHKYEYDADNRLHESYSSRDGVTWEKESKQLYNKAGGMGRVEIGDKTVQGLDYVYTINGWIKGMNRNTIGSSGEYMARDLGQDGENTSSTNLDKNVAADAAGFTLHYWQPQTGITADYTAINSSTAFQATMSGTDYGDAIVPQYNGNIAGMVTSMMDNTQTATEVQGRAFQYDQLYRIKQSLAFHKTAASNAWQSTGTYTQDNRYKETFSYDWNGNIKTVNRYDGTIGSAVKMDDLTYHYASNSNQLKYISDAVTGAVPCSHNDDLDDQSGFLDVNGANYVYDKFGELIKDHSERIGTTTGGAAIEWNPYGKMKAVHKDQANNTDPCTSTEYSDADVEYLYTPSQQRLCKIVKPHKPAGAGLTDQTDWTYYWYTYDAGGQLMGIYKQTFRHGTGSNYTVNIDLEEHDVYGSGRLGIRHGDDDGKYHQDFTGTLSGGNFNSITYTGASAAYSKTHFTRTLGLKQYEIANHLGNVLATISDKRLGHDIYTYTNTGSGSNYTYNSHQHEYYYTSGTGTYTQSAGSDGRVEWYAPDVLSYGDYYVFGAPEPGRNGGDSYRYGFNGKENDDEVKGSKGSMQDYGMRMYDPRVGRFFSADPLMVKYPYYTPYQYAGNMPISATDLDGGEPSEINGEKVYTHYTLPEGHRSVKTETHYYVDPNGNVLVYEHYDVYGTDCGKEYKSHEGYWIVHPGEVSHQGAEVTITDKKPVKAETPGALWLMEKAIDFYDGFQEGGKSVLFGALRQTAFAASQTMGISSFLFDQKEELSKTWSGLQKIGQIYSDATAPLGSERSTNFYTHTAFEGAHFVTTASAHDWGKAAGMTTAMAAMLAGGRYFPEALSAEDGITSGLPRQLHHYATNKHLYWTPRMRSIANEFGLELEESWNTEYLPHLGRHPNAYHQFVHDGMLRAAAEAEGDPARFLELFEEYVKRPIRNNPGLLRRSGWTL